MPRLFSSLPWVLLLAFPLLEVGAHAVTRMRVPSVADYRAAAAFVRGEFRARDLVVAAPGWTDPLVRQVLGDRIDQAMAGRSDVAGYERLWALSIRGARPPEAPRGEPELARSFGRVQVLRWALGESPVQFDFVAQSKQAQVRWVGPRGSGPCELRRTPAARGGGLGVGVLAPEWRFWCGPGSAWVGQVVMEDLDLQPRHCVYHPPAQSKRVQVSYRDVPLGDELVLYAGLYYEHERMRKGGPIMVRVLAGERELGRMVHDDGDGWKKLVLDTAGGGLGDVTFEVSAPESPARHFCWAASTRTRGAP